MTVAGVVLAAGAGTRLGAPKALARVGGERLVDRAVCALRDGGCALVYVVVGAAPVDDAAAVVVTNPDWRTGIASSLRCGLAAVAHGPDAARADADGPDADGAEAAVVTLADTPTVTAAHVGRLLAAWRRGAEVAVAVYAGAPRTPVLVARRHWAEVAALTHGDVGARAFLRVRPDLAVPVECGDLGPWSDVDTPEDLVEANTAH
ncbi:MAG: nucleotidyltransferase family protein [Actinomycetota bacterium]|nr:nucleotidyltransferase family protein [Actinomycetota bacterium]